MSDQTITDGVIGRQLMMTDVGVSERFACFVGDSRCQKLVMPIYVSQNNLDSGVLSFNPTGQSSSQRSPSTMFDVNNC